jgi:hypothetical protein
MPELATTLTSTTDERLDQAEGIVRAYCGWHIAPSRDSSELLSTKAGVLLLRSLHVTAVASITLADATVLDPTTYTWDASGIVRLNDGWCTDWWNQQSATIEYSHGYATPPAEVVGVVRALAQRGINNPGTVSSQTTGPFSITYATAAMALLADERVVLDKYRLPPRP